MADKIPLQKFLKMLTSGNVPVSKAMAASMKIYMQYNTPAQLSQLDDLKLISLGLDDKEFRKLVMGALRKAGYVGGPTSQNADSSIAGSSQPMTAVETITTSTNRKRKRNQDENEFLPKGPVDEASQYGSLDFNETMDEEVIRMKSTVVNRAPLMTAWATVVAKRMGFQREEALSIGLEQPPQDGSPGIFNTVNSYSDYNLKNACLPNPNKAMARSLERLTPQEINSKAWSLYCEFRPAVNEWGKRSEVKYSTILGLRKVTQQEPDSADGNEGTWDVATNIKYERNFGWV
ncbi:hypothetical protein MPER_11627 [Moniliophthora perniciosa FA553]|nr:hypothetical protein MPER_11627 [Moniliophthora perniciosa FA553]